MKIGTLAYACDSGLGVLARSFFDAGVVTNPIIVRHAYWPTHAEWYPKNTPVVEARRMMQSSREVRTRLGGMDAFLAFETPFDWALFPYLRSHGVRTVLMPMYECMPVTLPATPDLLLCPSLLDLRWAATVPGQSRPPVYLSVPVTGIPWRRRGKVQTFLHNAGHLGLRGRNGTGTLLDAMKFVESPCKLVIQTQSKLPWSVPDDPRIEVRIGTFQRESLYDEGECFVFPERFNGLSLPLQEAHAAGMLVMCGDRFPMNEWLPREPLIPVDRYEQARVSPRCIEYDEAVFDPRAVATTMDAWYNKDAGSFSDAGKTWSEQNSWANSKDKYLEALS